MTTTNDWRETVTGETITRRQIREWLEAAGQAGDLEAVDTCELALEGDADARALVAGWHQDAWASAD